MSDYDSLLKLIYTPFLTLIQRKKIWDI
jgi:hypothetical protein